MKLALAITTASVIGKRVDMMRAGQWSQVYKALPTRLRIRPVYRTRRAKSLIEDNAISEAVEALNAPLECEGPTVSDADIVTLRGLHRPSALPSDIHSPSRATILLVASIPCPPTARPLRQSGSPHRRSTPRLLQSSWWRQTIALYQTYCRF